MFQTTSLSLYNQEPVRGRPAVLPKVTLRDIAKAVGMSHVSVSLALRNSSQISAARREEIQQTAERMGYRPNAMATALGHQRRPRFKRTASEAIAWINYWRRPEDLRALREFNLYWEGAHEVMEQYGYQLREFAGRDYASSSALQKALLQEGVKGILIPPHCAGNILPSSWDKIHWEKFSMVRFGYTMPYPPVNVVTSNRLVSARIAVENAARLGYERIGFVVSSQFASHFRAGFSMQQFDLGKEEHIPVFVLPPGGNLLTEVASFSTWLKDNRPDAAISDIPAMAEVLIQQGYRIPDDIALASLSILDGKADAGIFQNSEEIGKAAAEMLIFQLSHNHFGIPRVPRQLLIEGKWIDGSMMPPRRNTTSSPGREESSRTACVEAPSEDISHSVALI